ncbi:phage major capsid protein [Niallia sp. 01092]|uniref:phage major capsid protein n=1 Tax=Niallia sp. 01092 TaxID=3457759 RepID=UPI003FD0F128
MTLEQMLARQQAIVNAAKVQQRDLSEAEKSEFDNLQRSIDAIRASASNTLTGNSGTPEPVNVEDLQRQAMEAERQRTIDIDSLCRSFGYDAQEYIKEGKSLDEVRALILEKQIAEKKPSSVGIIQDEGDKFRAAAKDGLSLRVGLQVEKPAPGATELRNLSLRELAKETLRLEGVANASRLSDDELLRQYMTPTSLFTGIMDQTARTVFEKAYTEASTTYQLWTKRGTLKDFRPTKTYQVGTAGELLLVPENGELKHDAPNAEAGPQRQLLTFGRQFTMSRQAFINDDVDFISTIPALYAQSARLGINRLVYQLLAKNPAIWDGKQLFSSDNGNISSVGSAPSVEALSDMRIKMRNQKAAGGEVKLNIPAKFMLVPTALETKAGQLIGASVDPAQTNPNIPNPFFNSFTIISDAELDEATENGVKEWYLTADQLRSPIQVDYLNGVDMPTIVMKQPPAGQLGYMWDIYIDYGVTIVDYKTAIKNNGQ